MLVRHQVLIAWIAVWGTAVVSLALALSVLAGMSTQVPFKVGFAGTLGKGLPLSGGGIYLSSPTLADLNHDGKLEILIGSGRDLDGVYRGNSDIHAVRYDGTLLWSVRPRPTAEAWSG